MNETLKQLTLGYKRSSDQRKKTEILEKIRLAEKTKKDFYDLLDLGKDSNLDLEFYKMVLDCFFETNFDRFSLASIHGRLKGRALENYFIGDLQRKNMDFKFLESLYLDLSENPDLAKIVLDVMTTTAFSLDNFLFLLIQDKLDKEQEAKMLAELRRQNGCLNFWIKALERAKSESALKAYAENLLRQKITKRNFESIHDLYLDNPDAKVASLMLEIMANLAKTEKEVDTVLYLIDKEHKSFTIVERKKKKFTDED
jgi:hypothetical protein